MMIDLIEQLKQEIHAATGLPPTHIKIGTLIRTMIDTEVKYQQHVVNEHHEYATICGLIVDQSNTDLFIGVW